MQQALECKAPKLITLNQSFNIPEVRKSILEFSQYISSGNSIQLPIAKERFGTTQIHSIRTLIENNNQEGHSKSNLTIVYRGRDLDAK